MLDLFSRRNFTRSHIHFLARQPDRSLTILHAMINFQLVNVFDVVVGGCCCCFFCIIQLNLGYGSTAKFHIHVIYINEINSLPFAHNSKARVCVMCACVCVSPSLGPLSLSLSRTRAQKRSQYSSLQIRFINLFHSQWPFFIFHVFFFSKKFRCKILFVLFVTFLLKAFSLYARTLARSDCYCYYAIMLLLLVVLLMLCAAARPFYCSLFMLLCM